eukprot:GEMP01024419.1.p1 GENE.GEMP01024419.1~~GEMP01024419.1.p1  ORF type:complete len:368 (+),score=77.28 GEMP01024419.1:311-1414(+)
MDFDDLPPRGNHELALAKAQEEAAFLGLTRRDPKILCTNVGIMQRVEADGPWEFRGAMDIPDGQFAGRFEFVLRVNKDYPDSCPKVRIISNPSLRRHPNLNDGELTSAFYHQLESYRMRDVVAMVEHFFSTHLPGLEKVESLVETRYRPLRKHPALFDALHIDQFLHPEFLNATSWQDILLPVDEDGCKAYTFPLFSREACAAVIEEIDSFYESKLPARRPNSMNNYGIIVNNIGLEPFINGLMARLQPIGEYFFPGAGHEWDNHHSFVVRYTIGEDVGLDMHTDDSDVTFNINLGRDFADGDLQVCGVMGRKDHRKSKVRIKHELGRCIVHLWEAKARRMSHHRGRPHEFDHVDALVHLSPESGVS